MTDSPVYLTFTRQQAPGQSPTVRIDAREGLKLVARLEMSSADYANAQFGDEVIAAYSTGGDR